MDYLEEAEMLKEWEEWLKDEESDKEIEEYERWLKQQPKSDEKEEPRPKAMKKEEPPEDDLF